MKKFLVFLLAIMPAISSCSCAFGNVPIDETNFPDEIFRAYIMSADVSIDKNQDGYLSNKEIADVTAISLTGGA